MIEITGSLGRRRTPARQGTEELGWHNFETTPRNSHMLMQRPRDPSEGLGRNRRPKCRPRPWKLASGLQNAIKGHPGRQLNLTFEGAAHPKREINNLAWSEPIREKNSGSAPGSLPGANLFRPELRQ